MDQDSLRRIPTRINQRAYPACNGIPGSCAFEQFTLFVDHAQGDPLVALSGVGARVKQDAADLPPELSKTRVRRLALEDFLAR